jgi:nicotinamidase-related amidase
MARITDAAHLCIDMQNIFAKGGVWETPWMERVLPVISDIAARYTERTVFTRFITPQQPEDRRGQWQSYFTKWKRATRGNLEPGALDIVPALSRYSPPALTVDKPAYWAFFGSRLGHLLVE